MAFAHGQHHRNLLYDDPPPFSELCSERAKWELYVDSTLHTYLLNEERMDTQHFHGQNVPQETPDAVRRCPHAILNSAPMRETVCLL